VLLSNPGLVELMQKVRAPYPLPAPVIEAALRLTDEHGRIQMTERVKTLSAERERLSSRLSQLSNVEAVYPSHANFVLIRVKNEPEVMHRTREQGLILRSRTSDVGLERCIRITVGTETENNILLAVLAEGGDK
jgi:histidinol-phosphate/aromatic aminotransferase/cobyric acid decarboxylase-like protein